MTDLYVRSKFAGELIVVTFDFADFLAREGEAHADFTPLLESGLSVLTSRVEGAVIRLWLTGGAAGESYLYGVRADTPGGESSTQLRLLHVRNALTPEPVLPPGGELYLVNDLGELLVTADGEALYSE